MSLGVTKLDICNMALRHLGSDAIADFNEASKSGRLCRTYFDLNRDETLRSYLWKCAMTRASLARDTVTPSFGWDFQYHLPADPWCLRVHHMQEKNMEFIVEGRLLLTDQSTAQIKYVKRVESFGELDADCVSIMAIRLATKMAVGMRGSDGIRIMNELINHLRSEIIPNAHANSAFEELVPDFNKINAGDWMSARRRGAAPSSIMRLIN